MKNLVVVAVLVAVVMIVLWIRGSSDNRSAPSMTIPVVWGSPVNGEIEMNAIVGVMLAAKSRKNEKEESRNKDWDAWIQTHCVLKSDSGETIPFKRQTTSKLVRSHEVQDMVSTEEFFLAAMLKPGNKYNFDYIIETPDREVYRCLLDAPGQQEKVKEYRFELAKKQ